MDAQRQAREDVFKAISAAMNDAEDYTGGTRAAMVRDAAVAWRALTGGQQPGAVVVESK